MADIKNIPILMYHHVLERNDLNESTWGDLYIDIKDFAAHSGFLKDAGYTTMDFDDLAEVIDGKKAAPAKPVIIVLDDAYAVSLSNVLPIIKQNGQKAVIALVTGCVGGPATWEKACQENYDVVKEDLARSYSGDPFSFVSHTVSHPFLTKLNDEDLESELRGSKKYLEELTGKKMNTLVYPYGDRDERVKAAVKAAGYSFGVSVSAKSRYVLEDLYDLRRIYVKSGNNVGTLKRKMSGWYMWYRGLRRR